MSSGRSLRQGLFFFFSILMIFVGVYFLEMSYFEALVIVALAGIVNKLTDIEEVLEK